MVLNLWRMFSSGVVLCASSKDTQDNLATCWAEYVEYKEASGRRNVRCTCRMRLLPGELILKRVLG